MSLSDALEAAATSAPTIARRRTAPTGFELGVRYEAGNLASEVVLTTAEVPEDEKGWRDEIKRVYNVDLPENRRVEIAQLRHWGNPAQPMIYVRYRITDRPDARPDVDYPALIKTAKIAPRRTPKTAPDRVRVIIGGDDQVGKVDHRGGLDAYLSRKANIAAQLDDLMRREPCAEAVILDPGDLVEGFESTGQQSFTNDLSLPEQLEMARHMVTHLVSVVSAHHKTTRVATVPSNHGAWRRGKDRLGKPSDDFGIDVHKAVAEAFALAKRTDVTWIIPEPWQESLALQVGGAIVGLAHGHQVSRPDGIPDWWAKQTHGGGPLAAATILVTGHYHHLRIQPTGQIDGRDRWWMQAPTLDNGSSWFRNAGGGSDSEPGLLTFTIDDTGRWDNLRLITEAEERS